MKSIATKYFIAVISLALLQNGVTCPQFSAPCESSEKCHEIYNTHYLCGSDFKCRHQNPWHATPGYIIGYILIVLISAVANAGGLGGGAVIVPVYMFQFNYVPFEAIPQSKATILAGAIMNVILIINRRQKDNENVFMINYGLAGACIPLLLGGTMIGVMLTKILPPIIVVIQQSIYLMYSGWKMFQKARSETKKENLIRQKQLEKENDPQVGKSLIDETQDANQDEQENVEGTVQNREKKNENTVQNEQKNESVDKKSLVSVKSEKPAMRAKFCSLFKYVYQDVLFSVLAYLTIQMVAFFRGGDGMKSVVGLEFCSGGAWGLFVLAQLMCVACSLGSVYRNRKVQLDPNTSEIQEKNEDEMTNNNEIKSETNGQNVNKSNSQAESMTTQQAAEQKLFDEKKEKLRCNLTSQLFASYGAGIGAGTLGIGGGMIMNPIFLSMGVPTEIAACVAGFSVLFTSSSTTSQFAIAGAIDMTQAFIFLIFSSVGSLIGNCIILRAVDKYKRPSILIWILFAILSLAMQVLPAMGIYKAVERGHVFQFDSPC